MRITTRKAALAGFTTIAVLGMLAACAPAPEAPTTGASDNVGSQAPAALDFLPCMVSDSGGFDDKSFNQLGYEGLKAAADELGVEEKHVQSDADTDYEPNITQLLDQGCDLIVTVGFNLADATKAAAEANPEVNFAIIDDATIDAPNVKPFIFDTAQAAFLAGYAAASYSKTSVVGTYGGQPFPTVTIFMDGFVDGVKYFNEQKGKNVKTIGWSVAKQDGSFTGGFEAGTDSKNAAQALIDQKADVILPVGGPIFTSAVEAIRDNDAKDIAMIGVDADLYVTNTQDAGSLFLTSIMKSIKQGVEDVVKAAATDKFVSDPYVGTLENGGVGLAPFHDFESKVDSGLQGELDAIKAGIIDGSIKVESPSSPKQ